VVRHANITCTHDIHTAMERENEEEARSETDFVNES